MGIDKIWTLILLRSLARWWWEIQYRNSTVGRCVEAREGRIQSVLPASRVFMSNCTPHTHAADKWAKTIKKYSKECKFCHLSWETSDGRKVLLVVEVTSTSEDGSSLCLLGPGESSTMDSVRSIT